MTDSSSPSSQALMVPPQNIEAEESLLSAIILDNNTLLDVLDVLSPKDFYSPSHQRIFEAIVKLFTENIPVDLVTLNDILVKNGHIDKIGGQGYRGTMYLAWLVDAAPIAANAAHYARIVRDKACLRRLIEKCGQITHQCYGNQGNVDEVMNFAQSSIFEVSENKISQGFYSMHELIEANIDALESRQVNQNLITGVSTGFTELDKLTAGFQPSDLIILAARPSMGKCCDAKTEIILSDGGVATIEEIYHRRRAQILTLNAQWKFNLTQPSDFIDDGKKPVFRVTTRLGRFVETTLTHPFLTLNGWKPLNELKAGHKIAVPRKTEIFGSKSMRECEIKLLAYLIGDGSLTGSNPKFTNTNPKILDDFIKAVDCFGDENSLTAWLRELKLYNKNAHNKFIPDSIFKLPKHLMALFLNRLFATDGWASLLSSGQSQLGYSSVSEKLIRQVQHLLLRFGIIAKIRKRAIKYAGQRNFAWQLDITDADSIRIFIKEIGIFGKQRAIQKIHKAMASKKYKTNTDLIPLEIWDILAKVKNNEPWAQLARRAGIKGYTNIHVGKRAMPRKRLADLSKALKNEPLQQLAKSDIYWDEIISIEAVGERQVYDLTIPETHNFVANDVCVHNTAFALNIARNAAVEADVPVAVFSLEMSKEQLSMRMLSAESRVDATRMRSGFLKPNEDWPFLTEAASVLSQAPIYIDDSPGLSVIEIRAKCRRLKMDKGLGLVIIDYMQLMRGSSTERRELEISEISRSLKALAKELNIPVVALSQLNRKLEERSDKRPMLSDLRESGCLSGDTLITLSTGKRVPIKTLVSRKKNIEIFALNETNYKIEKTKISNAFSTGIKPVYLLTTASGRQIKATANHKFRTLEGWKRLDQLNIGECIAVPREINTCNPSYNMKDSELALLGHLIGDGCTLPTHSIQYTTKEKDLAEIVATLAVDIFKDDITPRINKERNWYQVYLASTRHHTHGVRNAISEWLTELSVFGLRSHEKRVPEKVFKQSKKSVAIFLKHLWATDGCIRLRKIKNKNPTSNIYYATSSFILAQDILTLLLRFSITATIHKVSQGTKGKDQYHICVTGKPDLEKFINEIDAVGAYKKQSMEEIKNALKLIKSNTNRDIIPKEAWHKYVIPAIQEQGLSTRKMQAKINTAYCGTTLYKSGLSRERTKKVACVVNSSDLLLLSNSAVYWDKIKSIQYDGEEETFDLTIPNYHNFVANNIITHNSIEQDADVVAFIYREAVYIKNKEEIPPDKENIAEIILGKQRNGPTGTVKLTFMKIYTRFENLEHGNYDSYNT